MPDYLNKNGYVYTEQELQDYALEDNMSFDDYLKSKSFTKVDTEIESNEKQMEKEILFNNSWLIWFYD